jgi:Calcineurin-like phosphoesterase superfamily domain
MKLGLLTDIHESVENLLTTLDRLEEAGAERYIVLGDLFETGKMLVETIEPLLNLPVDGVWGNHDLGLSLEPSDSVRTRYGEAVMHFFLQLRGSVSIEDCLFTHAQPWMNPSDPEQPWYVYPPPWEAEMLAKNFAATEARVMFMGHHHQWRAMTPAGPGDWSGTEPITLSRDQRWLVVVNGVMDGWCGLYDTESTVLTPMQIGTRKQG